ncbi:MAG: hypothetical protein JWN34_1536 [Bryobacterales bacterium]|nr:hypothetical protein [Bryobacterales bacterium]
MTDPLQKVREDFNQWHRREFGFVPEIGTHPQSEAYFRGWKARGEQAPTEPVVRLEDGARALAKASGINDWFKATDEFLDDAKACAEAWGLKYVK